MKSYIGIVLYKLFPESVGNFFDNTIFGTIILWLVPLFILLWILTSIFLFFADSKEDFIERKKLQGLNNKYSFTDYVKESLRRWWSKNGKGFIKAVITIFLIFLPMILVIMYGISKGIF